MSAAPSCVTCRRAMRYDAQLGIVSGILFGQYYCSRCRAGTGMHPVRTTNWDYELKELLRQHGRANS